MKTEIENAISDYERYCNLLVQMFATKQELFDWDWIGDEVGVVADFCDAYVFQMHEILHDLKTNQPKGLILDWTNDTTDYNMLREELFVINYQSYCKGARYEMLNDND